MGDVRYGARPVEAQSNREVEATRSPIWSKAVTVVFRTDPEAIAAVLPRPLEPAAPTARLRIAVVDMGNGIADLRCRLVRRPGPARPGRGRVRPLHADEHRAGDDRRTRDVRRAEEDRPAVTSTSTATRSSAQVVPDGVEGGRGVRAPSVPRRPGYEIDKLDFYFKRLPDPSGVGLDARPGPRLLPPPRDGPGGPARSPASASCSRPRSTRSPTSRSRRSSPSSTPRSPRRRWARSWSGCRPNGWSRSCTSATTT